MTDRPASHDDQVRAASESLTWTLEETASRLEATLQGVRMPLAMLDFASGLVRCNRACLELFGILPDALARDGVKAIEASVTRLLKQPDAAPHFWEIPPGVERRDVVQFIDGRAFERIVTPCDLGARIVGHVVSYREVTDAAHAKQALEESRALLEQAQQVAHVGSWVVDYGRGGTEWSLETMRIFGVTREEVPTTRDAFYRLVHPDDHAAVREALRRVAEPEGGYELEHRIVRPSGETRWVHSRAEVERDEDGGPRRLIGTIQDITERRRLEEQLRQAQKLEAVGRLAGGVAHDLNNALTSIVGYTELAMGALAHDHPATADVREIRRAAARAESVTRQLLAFSRKQPLKPRRFALPEVVIGISRMLTRFLGGRVELDVAVAPDIPAIVGDPGQIEQAIVNLCVNARDAMPEGGQLRISVGVGRLTTEFQSQHDRIPVGDYVELRVRDTGAGMSAETMAHIFEPFFTTKELGKGTGLGLATVYGTIKQIGGYIAVESTPGVGTTFTFRFPPALEPPAEEQPAAAAPPPNTDGVETPVIAPPAAAPAAENEVAPVNEPTVLIVEDEQPVRNLVLLSLANRGYRLLSAGSGAQALEVVANEPQSIDLLLTDANMPGMNGVELVRRLLSERPSLQVIIMSGFTEDLPLLGELEEKVGLLPKPFTPKDLRERVDRLIGRR